MDGLLLRCISLSLNLLISVCDMEDLTPYIHTHFLHGVPASELSDLANVQRRLNHLFVVFDMYHENPCIDVAAVFKYKFRHNQREIMEDMRYFHMMINTFTRTTRQMALDLVNWTAKKNIRDSAAVNDRAGMDRAAALLIRANQLDKPAPEDAERSAPPLPTVFTPMVEHIDPDRQTMDDKKLIEIMGEFGAMRDAQELSIERKLKELESEKESAKFLDDEK